jgi:hypothetical protein
MYARGHQMHLGLSTAPPHRPLPLAVPAQWQATAQAAVTAAAAVDASLAPLQLRSANVCVVNRYNERSKLGWHQGKQVCNLKYAVVVQHCVSFQLASVLPCHCCLVGFHILSLWLHCAGANRGQCGVAGQCHLSDLSLPSSASHVI